MLSGPPQAVSVVQLDNSSTVRVSWEPPLADIQDEPILEYRVRALALYLHFFHHSAPFWKSLEKPCTICRTLSTVLSETLVSCAGVVCRECVWTSDAVKPKCDRGSPPRTGGWPGSRDAVQRAGGCSDQHRTWRTQRASIYFHQWVLSCDSCLELELRVTFIGCYRLNWRKFLCNCKSCLLSSRVHIDEQIGVCDINAFSLQVKSQAIANQMNINSAFYEIKYWANISNDLLNIYSCSFHLQLNFVPLTKWFKTGVSKRIFINWIPKLFALCSFLNRLDYNWLTLSKWLFF